MRRCGSKFAMIGDAPRHRRCAVHHLCAHRPPRRGRAATILLLLASLHSRGHAEQKLPSFVVTIIVHRRAERERERESATRRCGSTRRPTSRAPTRRASRAHASIGAPLRAIVFLQIPRPMTFSRYTRGAYSNNSSLSITVLIACETTTKRSSSATLSACCMLFFSPFF